VSADKPGFVFEIEFPVLYRVVADSEEEAIDMVASLEGVEPSSCRKIGTLVYEEDITWEEGTDDGKILPFTGRQGPRRL